jgi:uncharacterized protein YlxP (DUF503 family)
MNQHLPILREMFPGKIFLDVEDLAQCLDVSTGHLHNLKSKRALPFACVDDGLSNRFRVSIVELANYLDALISKKNVHTAIVASTPPVIAKGRGRSR